MSHEHRALGFRPPPGSLAAEAQAAAARHPEGDGSHLDEDTLRDVALRDAERIKAVREMGGKGASFLWFMCGVWVCADLCFVEYLEGGSGETNADQAVPDAAGEAKAE